MKENTTSGGIQLGEDALYVDRYAPELIAPIPRANSRTLLFGDQEFAGQELAGQEFEGQAFSAQTHSHQALPFTGQDVWTSYELSWLDPKGKPQVAIAEFIFPFDSTAIIESKSFKYYLNSFNQTSISRDELRETLVRDLSHGAGGQVSVNLYPLDEFHSVGAFEGQCVDDLDIDVMHYKTDAALLQSDSETLVENERLYSHLLKSNCPVTGQPDWATVWIEYSGAKISPESYLQYIISFRQHQDFHENCVEKIFLDIQQQCGPKLLSVYARYTRRGGLDINPFRTNTGKAAPSMRLSRQ